MRLYTIRRKPTAWHEAKADCVVKTTSFREALTVYERWARLGPVRVEREGEYFLSNHLTYEKNYNH